MTMQLEGFEILSEQECRDLLGQTPVGRMALSVGAMPLVLPVNYGLMDGSVYFFTGEGTKLRNAIANTVVGFETDDYDRDSETGWSVMVVGVTSEVTDPAVIERAHQAGIRPWASGDHSHLVKITTELVSGRRIAKHPT